MSSKEKTIIGVLAVVIVLALVGIGVLAAKLLGGEETTAATAIPTGEEAVALPVTSTPAATPQEGEPPTAALPPSPPPGSPPPDQPPAGQPPGNQPLEGQPPGGPPPVIVFRAESAGPGLPAIITDHPLQPGHRYRLEIISADGSVQPIKGNWSQAATSAGGQVAPPQIEFFEGETPYTIEVVPPVADPAQWGLSISASPKDPVGQQIILVIILYDVTAGG